MPDNRIDVPITGPLKCPWSALFFWKIALPLKEILSRDCGFRAFALAEPIERDGVYLSGGSLKEFQMIGAACNKRQFFITAQTPARGRKRELLSPFRTSFPNEHHW